jgi:hypothetical protein
VIDGVVGKERQHLVDITALPGREKAVDQFLGFVLGHRVSLHHRDPSLRRLDRHRRMARKGVLRPSSLAVLARSRSG